jgi:BASS family bile acid:Na+ symporter
MGKLELIKLLATVAIALIGLSAGLAARPADLAWLWRQPGRLGRSLFSAVLVMPVVVLVVLIAIPLPRETQASLLMLAIVPAAPLAIGKSARQGGHPAYAISLQVTLILLMVVTIPLLQLALGGLFHRDLSLGALAATKRAVLTQVVPLGVGLLFAWRWPAGAQRLGPPVSKIALTVLLAIFVVVLVASGRVLLNLGATSYIAMTLVAALGVLAGHTLGGPTPDCRRTLAVFTALRHPGLAILLVTLNAPTLKVAPAVVAYLIVATVVLAVYHRFAGATAGEPRPGVGRHVPQR